MSFAERLTLVLFLCGGTILCAESAFCATVERPVIVDFTYESNKRPDPFTPPRTEEVTVAKKKGSGIADAEVVEDLQLQGIVWDPNAESFIFLNGQVLKKGQTVGPVTVVTIGRDRVDIDFRGERATLQVVPPKK